MGTRLGSTFESVWRATRDAVVRLNHLLVETGNSDDDLVFHIRARRMDLCFELAMQIMTRLGTAVSPADEVHGFRYFDDRDLMGFVDGTENPRGEAVFDAVMVGEEDAPVVEHDRRV